MPYKNRSLGIGLAVIILTVLVGCAPGGGDIKIQPSTTDSSSNDSNNTIIGGGQDPNAVCASYVTGGGQTIMGRFSAATGNCTYSPAFADAGNNIDVDLFVPALANGGAHVFEGSLFMGTPCDTDACLAAKGIVEGGDGPKLTIEAGATLAWQTSADFLIINRGAQLFAVGNANAPITFTSLSDVNGTVGPEDVQQWGGIVINGFAVTNKCVYTGVRGQPGFSLAPLTECHVRAEGAAGLDESFYGGDNDADSSGRLQYVRVKHTGATVGNGDELNGISFGAVGSNTVVENLEMYSTYDDGVEMFGGSVNITNYVAVYVRDDSIDIDEGYNGTFDTALVIQAESIGNHCIEADGLGSYDTLLPAEVENKINQNVNSNVAIRNLTCIVSPSALQGVFDPGAGWRLREGLFGVFSDSMVVSSWGVDSADSNYCLRLDNRSATAAVAGDIVFDNTVFSCEQKDNGGAVGAGTAYQWAEANGDNFFVDVAPGVLKNPTASTDTDLILLEGVPPLYSVPVAQVVVNDVTPDFTATPPGVARGYIGGISLTDVDWIQGWTYGILDGSRAQPLWFE